jgi:membrane-bound lytic murein transglycosylase D
MTSDEFQNLNPQMNRPVILAAGTPQILLPYDNANRFVRELPQYRGPLTSWTTWIAPKSMKSAEAAHAAGMPEEEFREVNRIPARMIVKAGSTLLVPRRNAMIADVSSTVADNATMMLAPDAPPLRKVSLRASRHDNVDSIARRYRVSAAQVAQWNDVGSGARFTAGQTIVVYVPNKARQATSQARSGGPRSPHAARVAASGTAKGSKPTKTTVAHKHVVAKN